MQPLVSVLAIVAYLAIATLVFARLRAVAYGEEATQTSYIWLLWPAALVLHGLALYTRIFAQGGLDLGFFHALSMVGWLVALLLLVVALRRPLENLAVVLLPFAAVTLGLDTLFREIPLTVRPLSPGVEAHIFVSLLAYSLLTIAALQAGVLAVQNQHLHNHHPGGFIKALPPLQHMECLLFRLIGLGFALLTVALVTGFIFLEDIFAQHLVHKTVLSAAAWLVFAILLWGRWRFGWRGRTAIRWTLGGFAVLALAYFGSKLVLELILNIPA